MRLHTLNSSEKYSGMFGNIENVSYCRWFDETFLKIQNRMKMEAVVRKGVMKKKYTGIFFSETATTQSFPRMQRVVKLSDFTALCAYSKEKVSEIKK